MLNFVHEGDGAVIGENFDFPIDNYHRRYKVGVTDTMKAFPEGWLQIGKTESRM